MKYYVKQSSFVFGMLLFMIVTAMAIVMIETTWIKVVLGLLNVALYVALLFIVFLGEGGQAYKTLRHNDRERLTIIQTGEDRKIDKAKEYHPVKGFMFGLGACLPLVICLLVHLIIHLAGGTSNIMGQIASVAYYALWLPVSAIIEIDYYSYYYLLYVLVALPIFTGVPYLVGALKIRKQENRLNAVKEIIEEAKR